MDFPVKRHFMAGTLNGETGQYARVLNQDLNTKEDLISLIMASSAFPGVLPYQKWRNSTWMDGGAKYDFDFLGGIKYCLKRGFKEENIIIDTILLSDLTYEKR